MEKNITKPSIQAARKSQVVHVLAQAERLRLVWEKLDGQGDDARSVAKSMQEKVL